MLTSAVTRYIVALNGKLHAINYIVKLNHYFNDNTSENAEALMYFEQNEYDEAFSLFKKLAAEHRDVQS